ncbi:Paraplegin [Hypsibius exemplaris]|uniref:Paraplegin n=1 Tax=Hypsibius exemplaris TaxID=2072580 RepID=A0A1W0X9A8_HYPEX|nr:Paraplegin [Hypsibius exemplaris]
MDRFRVGSVIMSRGRWHNTISRQGSLLFVRSHYVPCIAAHNSSTFASPISQRRSFIFSSPFRLRSEDSTAVGRLFQTTPLAWQGRWIHTGRLLFKEAPSVPEKSATPPDKKEGDSKKQGKEEEEDEDDKLNVLPRAVLWMLGAYLTVSLLSYVMPSADNGEGMRFISWNEFVYHMLQAGEVEQVVLKPDLQLAIIYLHEGAVIKGHRAEHRTYHMMLPDLSKFENDLRDAEASLGIRPGTEVPVVIERNQEGAWLLLLSLVALSLMTLWMFRSGTISMSKMGGMSDMFSGLTKAKYTLRDPLTATDKGVTFADVAGLREAKQEVMELVSYLKDQARYKELGAKIPKGVLLLGPPGCGKTLLAKAISNEASVPFLSMNGTEFVEMIGGLGASRVRSLFKEARARSPCIIYIDEIDAIGRKRSGGNAGMGGSGEEEQTLNQLLVEMDGMGSSEGVMVLASTNRPDVLDRALQRPGRFDRHITIDSPTILDREEIFQVYLKRIKLKGDVAKYAAHFAKLTPGMTGADIANVVNEAAIHAASLQKEKVDREDFEQALERIVAGAEKRSNILTGQEKEIVAYHESGHALVGWLLKNTDALLRVSIKPRTSHALGFAQYTPNEQKLFSSEDLLERMSMALGGRAAEAVIFNKVSTGAQNDLEKVTKMAYAQIRAYGMNPNVGLIAFPEVDSDERSAFLKKPYSKRLGAIMDTEARALVAKAYHLAENLLRDNKDKLVKLAESLLIKEQLSYEEVELLIGSPPYGAKSKISPTDWDAFNEETASDVKSPRDMPTSDGVPDLSEQYKKEVAENKT